MKMSKELPVIIRNTVCDRKMIEAPKTRRITLAFPTQRSLEGGLKLESVKFMMIGKITANRVIVTLARSDISKPAYTQPRIRHRYILE